MQIFTVIKLNKDSKKVIIIITQLFAISMHYRKINKILNLEFKPLVIKLCRS